MPGFSIHLTSDTSLTGHIDFIQIRNGAIYVVDFKLDAGSEKPIPQLIVYALALLRRAGCDCMTWFVLGSSTTISRSIRCMSFTSADTARLKTACVQFS